MAYNTGGGHYGMQPFRKVVAPSAKNSLDVVADSAAYVAESNIVRGRADVQDQSIQQRFVSGTRSPLVYSASRFRGQAVGAQSQNRGYHNKLVTGSNLLNDQVEKI